MTKPRPGLLSEIERDLLDDKPVAHVLRKFVLLGGRAGSADLRAWAGRELRGYEPEDDLPSYRTVFAPIQMDSITRTAHITGQRIGISDLPVFARDDIREEFELRVGIGEVEALRDNAQDRVVKLSLPGARELARFMQRGQPHVHIDSIYWSVSVAALDAVMDQVRTRLAELLAELRAVVPVGHDDPDRMQTQHAVNIVLNGKSRLSVQAMTTGDNNFVPLSDDGQKERPFWRASRVVGASVVGFATIVGTGLAVLQIL